MCAPPEARRALLRDLGWPQGEHPSTGTLIAHILDRLEYRCARDIVLMEGAAGEVMRAGHAAGGRASSEAEDAALDAVEDAEP